VGGRAGGVWVDHFWAVSVMCGAVGFPDNREGDNEVAGRGAPVESTGWSDALVITAYVHGRVG